MSVRIYIEGGAKGQKNDLRKGFRAFLESELGEQAAKRIKLILCGDGARAHSKFRKALSDHPEAFNILLVDSEGPVSVDSKQHMAQRQWDMTNVDPDRCCLMVQMTEAWFLSDQQALAAYFGNGFNASALPNASNVESIGVGRITDALKNATRNTKKQRYDKTRDAPKILAAIDPTKARQAARHCDDLFQTLENVLGSSA